MTPDPDEDLSDDGDLSDDEDSENGPFSALENLQDVLGSLPTLDIPNLITPELQRALNQPILDPEVLQQLQQPTIDPELLEELQQPVDPEVLESIQQPLIDQEALQALSEPAIDPGLLRALESLNNRELVQIYRTVAALEQVDKGHPDKIDEEDVQEDIEPPEQGGFLSTFLNITSAYLLRQSDDLPEEAVSHLRQVLQSDSVESKTESFREFIESVRDTGASLILFAAVFAYQATWGLYFDEEEESSEDGQNKDEEGDEDDEEEHNEG